MYRSDDATTMNGSDAAARPLLHGARVVRLGVVWALVGTLLGGGAALADRSNTWVTHMLGPLLFAATWWVLSLVVMALCERYPLHDRRALRLIGYGVIGLLVAGCHVVVYLSVSARASVFLHVTQPTTGREVAALYAWNVFAFALICLITNTMVSERRTLLAAQEAAALALQLERANALAADARARTLESQMQPHFLFNALHTIMVLMHQDVAAAATTLTRLSDLLRHALAAGASSETTLGDELAFASGYLEIERMRFSDRLRIVIDVPNSLRSASVPRLVLQPLVENAVRHGVARRAGASEICIRATSDQDVLVIEVRDRGADGPAVVRSIRADDGVGGMGMGIGTTQERLMLLYGDAASVAVTVRDDEAMSCMRLPLRMRDRASRVSDRKPA